MATVHDSIYEDAEDQDNPSPSGFYEGDVSFTSDMSMSGVDIAFPSIEGDSSEPEPYSGSFTSRPPSTRSSRRGSAVTSNSLVSPLPSEISVSSRPMPQANALDSRYSPRKDRPPFRNPASVRAMQMASPPPLLIPDASRDRSRGSYKHATPSRSARSESVSTTGTRRSRSHRDSLHKEYLAHQSPRLSATPQPLPLVLLHVTILPMQMPYTPEIMTKIMPEWLVENYKTLEDKLQDIVLMRRGLLIQHPRDEYDVLEERILESLELKAPRLLPCGHFMPPDSDDEDAYDEDTDSRDYAAGRDTSMSGGTVTADEDRYPTPNSDDASMCIDCRRHVTKPGHGTKRWDIKIYAANGLMRAGAWEAAWSEMERCDVEISPWISNEVRKTMEKKLEQVQEAAKTKAMYATELQRQIEEEADLQKKLQEEADAKIRAEKAELQSKIEAEAAALQKKLEEEAAEKRKLEATLSESIEKAKETVRLELEAQAIAEAKRVAERFRAMEDALKTEREKQTPPVLQPRMTSRSRSWSRHRTRSRSARRPRTEEVPLGTLLKNYFVLQLQDWRNFFILILAALVVFLLTNSNSNWTLHQATLGLAAGRPFTNVVGAVMPTATSVSTLVVTETLTVESAQETSSVPLEEEPDAVMLALAELSSATEILEGLDKPSISEETPTTAADEPASTEPAAGDLETSVDEDESMESARGPLFSETTPTGEESDAEPTTTEELDAPTESASAEIEEPTVDQDAPAESVSSSVVDDLDASLEPASPEAEPARTDDDANPDPEPEPTHHLDDADDDAPPAHEQDEL